MRKFITVFTIIFCITFLFSGVAFAKSYTKNEIEHFKELGFTEDEIANFDDREYQEYSKLNGKVISSVQKFYRVTPKEGFVEISKNQAIKEVFNYREKKRIKKNDNNKISLSSISILSGGTDTNSCSWMTQTTTVTDLGNKQFLFKNSFTWLTEPIWTLNDVVAITHSSSTSTISGSEYLKYIYDRWFYDDGIPLWQVDTITKTYYKAYAKNVNGYAFVFDLLGSDGGYVVENNRGYMVYKVNATPSNFIGYSNAFGHYAHQQVALLFGIDLFSGSMSVSPSFAFDQAPDTDVQFYIK
ncbi:hypothetical protein [Carboxydothermus hydrogenoformans]|uniref:Uncharacterized protein n=1 Tax=Carboxydothermus hydrogenoformans (strain ATCC BAA-161 / DSM 6008 / Z-2901) TaxID=246194 RepID=Q3AAX7_CARHZ|nr:hypothetical protein [Carboxydothermus hydrogenoformans]ABB14565.1 hypothetical protein CHY_1887 [Carboxydothermus hydrogenoformans Z-2901]